MRSELAKRVRLRFRAGILERLPAFRELKPGELARGSALFVWPYLEQLEFGVELIVAPKWDVFHIELGWTSQRMWPIQRWFVEVDDDLLGVEGRIRLRRLMGRGIQDLGWEISPVQLPDGQLIESEGNEPGLDVLMARADDLIEDALVATHTLGLHFFSRVAAARNLDLDTDRQKPGRETSGMGPAT